MSRHVSAHHKAFLESVKICSRFILRLLLRFGEKGGLLRNLEILYEKLGQAEG